MELVGVEEATLELTGTIPLSAAERFLGGLEPEPAGDDLAVVSLLALRMHRLRPWGVPAFLGVDYGEALWRVGAFLGDEMVWVAAACDLDKRSARSIGGWLVKYPTVPGVITREDAGDEGERWSIAAAGDYFEALALPREEEEMPEAVPPRRVLVHAEGTGWEIPWREDPAPWRRSAIVRVVDDVRARKAFELQPAEPLTWERVGLLHRGRGHHCGSARRLGG